MSSVHFKSRKILCCLLSLTLVFVSIPATQIFVQADSISEIKQQIKAYEKKQQQIENKIKNLESSKAEYKDIQSALDEKISNLQEQIDLYNSRIYKIQEEIDDNNTVIKEKKQQIDETKDAMKKRLRAIYIAGSYSELAVILSAEDYGDFLARTELMRGVTEHDTTMMQNLNDDIKEIDRLNEENKTKIADNKALKADLVDKQKELDTEYAAAQSKLNSISKSQNKLENDVDDIEEEIKEKERQIKEIEAAIRNAQSNSNLTFKGGGFAWPFQSSYYISCSYGQQSYRFHTGMDITTNGAYGKPIYAAADGKVIQTKWSNKGYGNYLTIDHGSGIATLYAHCSSLLVSTGQTVKRGQLIARCGSTGNSTGPHLHFEVRVNGKHVNPMNYSYSKGF